MLVVLGQNGIVSFSIRLAAFQARGGARVKLHRIRCHFQEVSHRRDYLKSKIMRNDSIGIKISID